MKDCIFCRIADNEIPSDKVYEDEDILAFRDIHPQAPVHILIMPKRHIKDILELSDEVSGLSAAILSGIKRVAEICGISGTGFRVINNCGEDAGQSVPHLHFHLLGGKILGEKIV